VQSVQSVESVNYLDPIVAGVGHAHMEAFCWRVRLQCRASLTLVRPLPLFRGVYFSFSVDFVLHE
jgi:hypothetical protein